MSHITFANVCCLLMSHSVWTICQDATHRNCTIHSILKMFNDFSLKTLDYFLNNTCLQVFLAWKEICGSIEVTQMGVFNLVHLGNGMLTERASSTCWCDFWLHRFLILILLVACFTFGHDHLSTWCYISYKGCTEFLRTGVLLSVEVFDRCFWFHPLYCDITDLCNVV